MDAADEELFARSLRHATESHSGADLDAALDELGWPEALAADPRVPTSTLFGLQGTTGSTSSALDLVVASGLGGGPAAGGVVLPPIGTTTPPGRSEAGRVAIRGLGTAGLGEAGPMLVVAHGPDGDHALLVEPGSLTRRRIEGLDPSLGLIEVAGSVPEPASPAPVDWAGGMALGQVALGHELVGAGRRMLEMARTHALDRVQFGVPVASFQAVRHRLAESLVALEQAAALLDASWLDPSPRRAAAAKAAAGRAARTAARHSQQVLAGIGFTTEHDLHHAVRRVLVLEQVLGSTSALIRALGEEALRRGGLPDPLGL